MADTQWVKNTETGQAWEVDPDHAKYLLKQQTADGDPAYQKTQAPKPKPAPSPDDDGQAGTDTGDGGTTGQQAGK